MSGTKSGSLDCATFKNHEAVRKSAGHDIGVPFFFAPSFWACKKKVLADKWRNRKLRRIKILSIDWIPIQDRYDDGSLFDIHITATLVHPCTSFPSARE